MADTDRKTRDSVIFSYKTGLLLLNPGEINSEPWEHPSVKKRIQKDYFYDVR